MSQFKPGDTVGKYKIVELLGRGGMAEVWKGYQEILDRNVAIKVMHAFLAADKDFIGRFRREARAMAALNHPNIAGVYDFDAMGDSYYIVMEYVAGGSLKDRLEDLGNRQQMLPLGAAVRLVLEVADALSYAHSRGMFHRDIKPANILLDDDDKAILVDFGIAKIMSGPSHTATGSMIGTPAYMSPEQGLGQPGDHRSDIYSLGVLFFQIVTGRIPFQAETPLAIVLKHVNEPIPSPSQINRSIPPQLERIILKGMAKEPEERYQSAGEMARDLRRALAEIDDSGLLRAVPAALLRDQPTPSPVKLSDETPPPVAETVVAGDPGATRLARPVPAADATRVATPMDRTEVVAAPAQPAAGAGGRRFSPWLIVGGIVLLLAIFGGGAGIWLLGGSDDGPTPTAQAAVATTSSAVVPVADGTPTQPPNFAATINAGLTATAAANPTQTRPPTATPTSSPTATPTRTPTPDLTAIALANCIFDVAFDQHFTFSNRTFSGVAVGFGQFPLNLVFVNEGTCDVPAGSTLTFVDGNGFDVDHPVELDEGLAVGDELIVIVDAVAPTAAGSIASSWVLTGPEAAPFETPFTFNLIAFVPATATPVASPTPAVTPTPTPPTSPLGFNPPTYQPCEYVGGGAIDYLCRGSLVIYGGSGAEYTVSIDTGPVQQGSTSNGGVFLFNVQARRCAEWLHTITIRDSSGASISRPLQFFPASRPDLFPGGACTEF